MAVYLEDIPYLITQNKRVALPRGDVKNGYGSLVFLFANTSDRAISMTSNSICYNANNYHRYYYNLQYKGSIMNKVYNIKETKQREEIYEKIKDNTKLKPHPPSLLNKTENKNTFFDMHTYIDLFNQRSLTTNVTLYTKMFWDYYTSIWTSPQTSAYPIKTILVDLINEEVNRGDRDILINMMKRSISTTLYYTLFKHLEMIKDLDIDFVFYNSYNKKMIKINPSLCDEKSYIIFKRELSKLQPSSIIKEDDDLNKEKEKADLKAKLKKSFNFLGDSDEENTPEEIDEVEHVIDKMVDGNVEKEVDVEDELASALYTKMVKKTIPTTPLSSARDKMLRDKQDNVLIGTMTLKELQALNASRRVIPKDDVSSHIKNINKNMTTVSYPNINKDYIENVLPITMAETFSSLNDKSMKVFIRDIKIEDSSDELNYKDTYRVTLEDEFKQRHSVTVDIPKFLDNKFLYLAGNKKIINKQNFLLPVVKTGPDTVQIVTNYNKMFMTRSSSKSISTVDKLMRLVGTDEDIAKLFTVGENSSVNNIYLTTIEYDELGKIFTTFTSGKTKLFFNQKEAHMFADDNNYEIYDDSVFVGVKDTKPIYVNIDSQITDDNQSIMDIILESFNEEQKKDFTSIKPAKKAMHNTVTVMAQSIPLVVLLMYWEGITSVLKKMNIEYRLEEKNTKNISPSESSIKFKDLTLVYKENMPNSLLLNGLRAMDAIKHDFLAFDNKDTYIEFFKKVYGRTNILNAIDNYHEFMVDNITKGILEDLNLPVDIVSLCIYGSNLLADDAYTIENNQRLSRIRSVEIIPAILYNELSKSYLTYKNSMGKKKISMPKDAVIKQLIGLQTVEEYSTLNPVVELEADRALSAKGFRGINMDRAYTEAKRSYDPSMIGIASMSTSPDGNVGINRFLTLEPNISSARGFTDIKEDKLNELTDANIFSPAELLYPLGNSRDDAIRTAMAGKQSKHVIPIKNATPALLTNGADEVIRFHLSSDFIINAEQDGEVIDYDEKNKIIMVKYKNGKVRAINLAPNIVKNGGGGFYLANVLVTDLKVGKKFKKNDALAWHKDFFASDELNGTRMNLGVLEKIAIMSCYATYNDSTIITHKLAKDAETDMTFAKSVVVGKNSNIYSMKKIGDHIEIGDELMTFDTSFDDSDLNKLLVSLNDDEKQTLENMSTQSIKSKYAGKIVDIKIYPAIEIEQMSSSLGKIVKSHQDKIKSKEKFVSKYDNSESIVKAGLLLNESTGVVKPNLYGLIKGNDVTDAVLIEFYIEHADLLGVGDKLAYFTALKSVIGEVIPEGYEPFSEFRPDEEVSSLIDPGAIQKRQVPSIQITLGGNKGIVELKRSLKTIYDETSNMSIAKRKKMEKLIFDFFSALDKTGRNTNKQKAFFKPLSDKEVDTFFKKLFADENLYICANIVDYEIDITMDDISDALDVLGVPLFEYITMPHFSMDKNDMVQSKYPVLVGYAHVKRVQQTVSKKNGLSTSVDSRSAITNQVTGADKNGRESDLENSMLLSLGFKDLLKELNGPRADDSVMKQEMYTTIQRDGQVSLNELTSKLSNKTTLNTVDTYMIGMGLKSDLVTKGLLVTKSIKDDIKN